jgi:1,4-dihydroxy-2-naphthoate octaprenyltransferase
MNAFLTMGVLTICASAIVAAATMRWGLLFASLTALVVVAWAILLQDLLDE